MKHYQGTFTLTKADAKALLSCAGNDATNDVTRGVFFNPSEAVAVSTDGVSMMVCQNISTATSGQCFVVPRFAFEDAVRVSRKADRIKVSFDGEWCKVTVLRLMKGFSDKWESVKLPSSTEEGSLLCAEPEKKGAGFPPWKSVVPARSETDGSSDVVHKKLNIAFNPDLLLRSKLMLDACNPAINRGVRWTIPCGELDPIRADTENPRSGVVWTLIVMPMRF